MPPTAFYSLTSYGTNYEASNSRITSYFGWAPSIGAAPTDHWIQVDLQVQRFVAAIVTKGLGDGSVSNEYVTSYKIAFSDDSIAWSFVTDSRGESLVFTGNVNRHVVFRNALPEVVLARYVRLYVVSYEGYPTLRWGVKGCPVA